MQTSFRHLLTSAAATAVLLVSVGVAQADQTSISNLTAPTPIPVATPTAAATPVATPTPSAAATPATLPNTGGDPLIFAGLAGAVLVALSVYKLSRR